MKATPTASNPIPNITEQDMEDPDLETEVVNQQETVKDEGGTIIEKRNQP